MSENMGDREQLRLLGDRINRSIEILTSADDRVARSEQPDIKAARVALLGDVALVQQIISSPADFHEQMTSYSAQMASLHWLCHFGIPAMVPLSGSITYTELANSARVPQDHLQRVTRVAVTSGLFQETEEGEVMHTALSAQLQRDKPFLDSCLFLTEVTAPAAAKMVEMTGMWDTSSSQNKLAFNLAFGTDLPMYAYMTQVSTMRARLVQAMKFKAASGFYRLEALVSGYDWANLGAATVIDVGGSGGTASIILANHFPSLSFVVQDLPEVIEQAKQEFSRNAQHEKIKARVTFEAQNFFEHQPAGRQDADVYFLRQVLNNWSDTEARTILSKIADNMKPTSRIIIMNGVLPKHGTVGIPEEARSRATDLFMLQASGGKERDMKEWQALVGGLDRKLEIKGVQKPEGSAYSVIEVVLSSG